MRIAIVSPFLVPPANNGASVRIHRLCAWLRRHGHELHFVWAQTEPFDIDPGTKLRSLTRAWGAATVLQHRGRPTNPSEQDWLLDDWIDPTHERPYRAAMNEFRPDVVLVNYIFLSRFLEWSPPDALKYLDTHDRLSRRELYETQGMQPGFFYTTIEDETRGCRRADAVFAIQDEEIEHFASMGVPVATVGHPEPPQYRPAPSNPSPNVGFVAAYNKFNAASLPPLLDELARTKVLERHGATLKIAGNLVRGTSRSGVIDDLPPCVEDVGFVKDLDSFYDSLDLVLNPTTVGTGLKIKTIEALSRGKPLVSTAVGSEGLPRRTPLHWARDIPGLVTSLESALRDPSALTSLANTSRHLHTEYLLNLERNLHNLFSPAAVEAARRSQLATFIEVATGHLNETDPATSISLADPPLPAGRVSMAHVINPHPAGFHSDLYAAQPITFETMRRAARYAADDHAHVDLISCLARTDSGPQPAGFHQCSEQAALVTDVATFQHPRPLPLLRSILQAGASESDAEWLIYTNADIAVMPHFYTYVAEKLRQGHDAIVINRRTISRQSISLRDLNSLYSQVGTKHPGFDCFVFHRDALEKYELGDICIGVHLVGRVLLWNLLAQARNPLFVTEDHLTFHLGDDNAGKRPELLDYTEHNTNEAIEVLARFEQNDELESLRDDRPDGFRPQIHNLRFNPTILTSRAGKLAEELAARPILIHALFRTGSTFVWQAFRSSKYQLALYEPLHEDLANIAVDNLEHFRQKHSLSNRHSFDGDWFFREYEPLLLPGHRGVPGYRGSLAYEGFADNAPQPVLRSYIDGLLQFALPRQPVLQFNRTALRQRWFHCEYPNATHVYLVRDPREQWASYLSFMTGGARGFARNDAIIAGMNLHRELFRPLNELVPLHHDTSQGNYFARYDQVFDRYSWMQRYAIFYYIWLQSLLEAAWTGSKIISMNDLASDRWTRMRCENFFAVRGAQVDLSGFTMTEYGPGDMPLSPTAFEEVEAVVQATITRHFGLAGVQRLPDPWHRLANDMLRAFHDPEVRLDPIESHEVAVTP